MSSENTLVKSNLKNVSAMLGGVETIPVGKLVTPRISASTVDPKIPNKMAPLTFLIRRKAINIIPKRKQ